MMNQQRKVVYAERRRILEGENLKEQALDMVRDVITAYVNGATAEGYAEDWDLDALWTALKTLYPVGIDHESLTRHDTDSERDDLTREELLEALLAMPNVPTPQGKPSWRNSPVRARCASWSGTCCST
ncbi:secA Wing and Scaffold domain protein [Mycobacterium kansasii]|uniref:SecA Wing and Scaffold domain protein n=1 Tax=Mycobacterium kansasii TaxID=1768 RepID=A0A1V3W971_MYCKA|nr:secA Wing and Scaffold domain protein [Mycobacterium kansasii]